MEVEAGFTEEGGGGVQRGGKIEVGGLRWG